MEENRTNLFAQPEGGLSEKDARIREIERRTRELEESFSYDDYVVVQKELFAHLRDPAVVIRPDSITFNQACIDGLPNTVYIRLSVNEQLHRILVEPCHEDTPHALRWCIANGEKRKSRKMMGTPFSNLLYSVMGWEKNIRYKVLGFRIRLYNTMAYVFLLDTPEKFDIVSTAKKNKTTKNLSEEEKITEKDQTDVDLKPKRSTIKGYYSDEVLQSFGMPVAEYRRNTEIVNTNGFVQIGMLTGGMDREGE